jgi:hypothetical protein
MATGAGSIDLRAYTSPADAVRRYVEGSTSPARCPRDRLVLESQMLARLHALSFEPSARVVIDLCDPINEITDPLEPSVTHPSSPSARTTRDGH